MTDVSIRIYWLGPANQMHLDEAVYYLATGHLPYRVWVMTASQEMIDEYHAADPERRQAMRTMEKEITVAAGHIVHHEAVAMFESTFPAWDGWDAFPETTVWIRPRTAEHTILMSFNHRVDYTVQQGYWVLQSIGAANQVAASAETLSPIIASYEQERQHP